ncbi:MAG: phosphopantetheine-binding protein [Pirellulaceae bacterium]
MICGTLRRVVEQISNVTRYPEELLTVDADLENDLGIDSVKNLEIVLAAWRRVFT